MTKQERNRAVNNYHIGVAVLLLFVGFGFLALGIWLTSTDNQSVADLNFNGESVFVVFHNYFWLSIFTCIFFLLSAIVSLIALARNCLGVTLRVVYVVMGLIIFLALLAECTISSLLLRNKENQDIKTFVQDAWKNTSEKVRCDFESRTECRGFESGDCENCETGTEPICEQESFRQLCATCLPESSSKDVPGCYNKILDFLDNLLLPIAIISGIISLVVLVDLLTTCFL